MVVAAIGDHTVGTPPGSADAATYRRHTVEQREQLGDVVAVAAGERPSKRDAATVYEEMLLATPTAAVDRARTGLRAPYMKGAGGANCALGALCVVDVAGSDRGGPAL